MYSLSTSESSFNFSASPSFSSSTSDPLLPSLTERVNDSSISSPLQINPLTPLPAQRQSFTSYSSHDLANQANGAYMQESLQLTVLQDRCQTLEQHLVKVTAERDTIKNLFDQLVNMIKLPMCDPTLILSSNLPLLPFSNANEKRPTRETNPNVRFWTKTDYDDWLDSPEAAGSNRGLYAYLKDENGDVPKSETLGKIRKALRAGWRELGQRGMAPDTWGKASTSAIHFMHSQMEKDFPLFKLTENGWKLEYICTKTYSAWRKHHLDDAGNLKRATRDMVKEEALDDDDDLEDCKPWNKKWKGHVETTTPSKKKQKVDNIATVPQTKATTTVHGKSFASPPSATSGTILDPAARVEPITLETRMVDGTRSPSRPMETARITALPAETVVTQSNTQEAGTTMADKSNTTLLALAAAKVNAMPVPPVLECSIKTPPNHNITEARPSTNTPSDTSGGGESSASTLPTKSKAKLRPSGTKNGRNLCMLRWLKQVDANGQKDDFREYYDKILTRARREAYDKEAKQLVETNNWTKTIIERGTLH
ncbi:hypothetical protein BKA83DRAFT_4121788 [Pisolithus microcarpus]|nr:hypothetical protein BKA83DRAFT_4121788 [Pisolithus microcarpus]